MIVNVPSVRRFEPPSRSGFCSAIIRGRRGLNSAARRGLLDHVTLVAMTTKYRWQCKKEGYNNHGE